MSGKTKNKRKTLPKEIEQLLEKADQFMYQAKRSRKGVESF